MMISTQDLTAIFYQYIEKTGEKLTDFDPIYCVKEIRRLLDRNIKSGRLQRVQKHHCHATVTIEQYAGQIIQHFLKNHVRIVNLKSGNEEEWQLLWDVLYKAAYKHLINYGWDQESAEERGKELTQETCVIIYYQNTYPYDCSFEAWALLILQNLIKRPIIRPKNPLDLPGQGRLEDPFDQSPNMSTDPNLDVTFQTIDDADQLFWAIQKLSSLAQRQVIIDIFFLGYDPTEVAERLGRTVSAVYMLKTKALKELRNILAVQKDFVVQGKKKQKNVLNVYRDPES